MVGRNSDVSRRHDNSTNTRHSLSNVKTRHSTGGIVNNVSANSRLRTGSAVKSTLTTRKRYSDTRKLDSPEAEFGDVVGNFKPSSPSVTTVISALSGRRSSASSRIRAKSVSSKGATTISKPISPNPSESSTATSVSGGKTSCISPDLLDGDGSVPTTSPQKQMWPNLDTHSIQLENRHLKDLLVSQLDLIQQQSETILSREKQLKDLRMENEHLRQRLERMERRVRVTGDSSSGGSGGANDSAQVPSTNSDNPFINSNSNKEATTPSTQQPTTPSSNPRKRPFSATLAEPSQRRPSTPPVIPAKRIKRESGTYSVVSSPVAVSKRSVAPHSPTVASSSSLLLPAKTSSPALTTPSLLPSKQQLKSALTAAASVTKEDIQSSSSSTTNEFPRFDELTDEIFEESDDRFRISHEDSKTINSGGGTSSDSTIPEHIVKSSSDKRRKSESIAVNKCVGSSNKIKQRACQKQAEDAEQQKHHGEEDSKSADLEPLSTLYHYHVGCMKELVNKDDKLTECTILHQLGVEVPKFRKDVDYDKKMGKINSSNNRNPYNKYKEEIEGLENAVFLKRHDKPEQLEKKTKKWDIQRLREQQRNEKLRARYDQSGIKTKKQQPDTLLPSPEDAKIIMICEDGHLPVSVFGESVPAFPQSTFCLPWVGKKQGKCEVSKRSRQNNSGQSSRSSKH